MSPVPIRVSNLQEWEEAFETMPLDELVELRRLLVYVLVKRRTREREARR